MQTSVAGLPVLCAAVLLVACDASKPLREPPQESYAPVQMQLTRSGASESVKGALVSAEFFEPHLPLLGRVFSSSEYKPASTAVAVISRSLWTRVFESRPETIGSVVQLNGRPVTVIGVKQPGFGSDRTGEIWVPGTSQAEATPPRDPPR